MIENYIFSFKRSEHKLNVTKQAKLNDVKKRPSSGMKQYILWLSKEIYANKKEWGIAQNKERFWNKLTFFSENLFSNILILILKAIFRLF